MHQVYNSNITGQNISSYLYVSGYTADIPRSILVRCTLNGIMGGDDYSIYATLQENGVGIENIIQPLNSYYVNSGINGISFPSIMIPLNKSDVVKLYVSGLSLDTNVNINTSWFDLSIASASAVENIVSTSASSVWGYGTRTITSASGLELASASSIDNITGTSASTIWTYGTRELTTSNPSTSASEIWAYDTRTITSASDLGLASGSSVDNITGTTASTIWEYNTRTITSASGLGLASASSVESITGTSASTIWTYGSRTLTSFGTLVTDIWNYITRTLSPRSQGDVTSETTINCFRGDTFTYVFNGLDFSNYSKIYVTIKKNYQDLDSAAIVQVDSVSGLLYLNGVASASPTMASITVNSVDRATLVLKPFVTSQIPYGSYTLYYDIQIMYTTGVIRTLQYGEFVLGRDVTRRIT